MQPNIILASSSAYRRQQLQQLGIPFQALAPKVDETPQPGESAHALAKRLSLSKARAIASLHPHALIVGSDQVGELDGRLLSKPGSEALAIAQLTQCSGRDVFFYSGVSVVSTRGTECRSLVTQVKFKSLTHSQIAAYIKKEQPLDCAGSFKCEGLGIALFESISSDDPSALIGLPLIALCQMLTQAGLDPLTYQGATSLLQSPPASTRTRN